MHAIYETLKKTKGKTDAEAMIAAAKGLKWESPRGPMMIDPRRATWCRTCTSAACRKSAMSWSTCRSTPSRW